VILNLHKLMAYKDEYEVARLALDRVSAERLAGMFDGEVRISHYLNPPTLRRFRVGKIAVGPWFRPLFSCLRALRGLRATRWDPFGRTPCRKLERELVTWYRSLLQEVAELLSRPGTTAGDRTRAVEIAEAPDSIRGYEQVKIESAAKARAQAEARLQQLRGGADRR
jgi:indolepyruvate ferredoxin oxidoreductase